MKKSMFLIVAATSLAVLTSAAFTQQTMTNGVVTKMDEPHGTIRIQYDQPGTTGASADTSEDFKVNDGLLFNALQVGDKIQFSAEQAAGGKTITKLQKR